MSMSPATPTPTAQPRNRDKPGRTPTGKGGPTAYTAREREDPQIDPLVSADAAEPVAETIYTKWYATPSEKVDAVKAEVDRIVTTLGTADNWEAMLNTMGKFHYMSLSNQIALNAQMPNATRVAMYVKWDELGRHVRKGVKGIVVLSQKRERVAVMDDAGRPVFGADGKRRMELCFTETTTTAVFDISQTDGPDLAPARTLTSTPPNGFINDLKQAALDLGFTVVYEPIDEPGVTGFTTLDGEPRIVIKEGASSANVARVLAHELGHISTGHVHRADYTDGHGDADGRPEAEAASVAYTLLRANGMKPDPAHTPAKILAAWDLPDAATVESAAATVHQAVRGLLTNNRWVNALL